MQFENESNNSEQERHMKDIINLAAYLEAEEGLSDGNANVDPQFNASSSRRTQIQSRARSEQRNNDSDDTDIIYKITEKFRISEFPFRYNVVEDSDSGSVIRLSPLEQILSFSLDHYLYSSYNEIFDTHGNQGSDTVGRKRQRNSDMFGLPFDIKLGRTPPFKSNPDFFLQIHGIHRFQTNSSFIDLLVANWNMRCTSFTFDGRSHLDLRPLLKSQLHAYDITLVDKEGKKIKVLLSPKWNSWVNTGAILESSERISGEIEDESTVRERLDTYNLGISSPAKRIPSPHILDSDTRSSFSETLHEVASPDIVGLKNCVIKPLFSQDPLDLRNHISLRIDGVAEHSYFIGFVLEDFECVYRDAANLSSFLLKTPSDTSEDLTIARIFPFSGIKKPTMSLQQRQNIPIPSTNTVGYYVHLRCTDDEILRYKSIKPKTPYQSQQESLITNNLRGHKKSISDILKFIWNEKCANRDERPSSESAARLISPDRNSVQYTFGYTYDPISLDPNTYELTSYPTAIPEDLRIVGRVVSKSAINNYITTSRDVSRSGSEYTRSVQNPGYLQRFSINFSFEIVDWSLYQGETLIVRADDNEESLEPEDAFPKKLPRRLRCVCWARLAILENVYPDIKVGDVLCFWKWRIKIRGEFGNIQGESYIPLIDQPDPTQRWNWDWELVLNPVQGKNPLSEFPFKKINAGHYYDGESMKSKSTTVRKTHAEETLKMMVARFGSWDAFCGLLWPKRSTLTEGQGVDPYNLYSNVVPLRLARQELLYPELGMDTDRELSSLIPPGATVEILGRIVSISSIYVDDSTVFRICWRWVEIAQKWHGDEAAAGSTAETTTPSIDYALVKLYSTSQLEELSTMDPGMIIKTKCRIVSCVIDSVSTNPQQPDSTYFVSTTSSSFQLFDSKMLEERQKKTVSLTNFKNLEKMIPSMDEIKLYCFDIGTTNPLITLNSNQAYSSNYGFEEQTAAQLLASLKSISTTINQDIRFGVPPAAIPRRPPPTLAPVARIENDTSDDSDVRFNEYSWPDVSEERLRQSLIEITKFGIGDLIPLISFEDLHSWVSHLSLGSIKYSWLRGRVRDFQIYGVANGSTYDFDEADPTIFLEEEEEIVSHGVLQVGTFVPPIRPLFLVPKRIENDNIDGWNLSNPEKITGLGQIGAGPFVRIKLTPTEAENASPQDVLSVGVTPNWFNWRKYCSINPSKDSEVSVVINNDAWMYNSFLSVFEAELKEFELDIGLDSDEKIWDEWFEHLENINGICLLEWHRVSPFSVRCRIVKWLSM